MHKIIVFDLDGTLCPVGKGMLSEDTALLRQLEDTGVTVAICSGKPTYYLCGFMRQAGLKAPILIGENGCTIQFGISLPPERSWKCSSGEDVRGAMDILKERIVSACGQRVWFQPNEVMLTPFPRDEQAFEDIRQVLSDCSDILYGFNIYSHHDSFDITPRGADKGTALKQLAKMLDSDSSEFIAVGDGENDISMFDFADISISLHHRLEYKTDLEYDTLREALEYLLELMDNEKQILVQAEVEKHV